MSDTNDQTDAPAAESEVADLPVDPTVEGEVSGEADAAAPEEGDAAPADVEDAGGDGEAADVAAAADDVEHIDIPVGATSGVTYPDGVFETFGGSHGEHEYRGYLLTFDKTIQSKAERREQIVAFEAHIDRLVDGELDG